MSRHAALQGLIRLPRHESFRRIDIRLAPYHSYPYMLLGSSGDAMLMKLLRHTAKQKGMCLNEYGMGDKVRSLGLASIDAAEPLTLPPLPSSTRPRTRCVARVPSFLPLAPALTMLLFLACRIRTASSQARSSWSRASARSLTCSACPTSVPRSRLPCCPSR